MFHDNLTGYRPARNEEDNYNVIGLFASVL